MLAISCARLRAFAVRFFFQFLFVLLLITASSAVPSARAQQAIQVANGDVAGLIAAIQNLNADGGGTINLAAGGTYSASAASDWWYGPNAFPAISSTIVINGNGATISRASASPKFRFFFVSGGFSTLPAGNLTLQNLTLVGGLAQGGNGGAGLPPGGGAAGLGGAIFNQGNLTLTGVTLQSDTAYGGSGGNFVDYLSPGGGGGLGGNGGSGITSENYTSGGAGGGFKGNGSDGGARNGGTGGSFLGSEGGSPCAGGGQSTLGGNGGNSGGPNYLGGGGGGGFTVGQNGGNSSQTPNSYFDGGGGGAIGAGAGGGGSTEYDGTCGGGGGAFGGGGGAGSFLGGGGGGGVGGGGGSGTLAGNGGFGGGGGGGGSIGSGQGGFGGGSAGQYCNSCSPVVSIFGGGSGTAGGDAVYSGGGAGLGGAIFNHQGTANIVNSTFTSNAAIGGSGGGTADGFGGALLNLDGTVTLNTVSFSGNTATASGGNPDSGSAVYNLSHNAGNTVANQVPSALLYLNNTTIPSGALANNQVNGTANSLLRATVILGNLTQTFAGTPLLPTVTTLPAGLNVVWTGGPQTNAGSYTVAATISSPGYFGTATATFVINPYPVTLNVQAVPLYYFQGSAASATNPPPPACANMPAPCAQYGDKVQFNVQLSPAAIGGQSALRASCGGTNQGCVNLTLTGPAGAGIPLELPMNNSSSSTTAGSAVVTLSGAPGAYMASVLPVSPNPNFLITPTAVQFTEVQRPASITYTGLKDFTVSSSSSTEPLTFSYSVVDAGKLAKADPYFDGNVENTDNAQFALTLAGSAPTAPSYTAVCGPQYVAGDVSSLLSILPPLGRGTLVCTLPAVPVNGTYTLTASAGPHSYYFPAEGSTQLTITDGNNGAGSVVAEGMQSASYLDRTDDGAVGKFNPGGLLLPAPGTRVRIDLESRYFRKPEPGLAGEARITIVSKCIQDLPGYKPAPGRDGVCTYEIKSKTVENLSIYPVAGHPTYATFSATATIQDVTHEAPVTVANEVQLQIQMYAAAGRGRGQNTIAIQAADANEGLWFSNNWNGTQTELSPTAPLLESGVLIVSSN